MRDATSDQLRESRSTGAQRGRKRSLRSAAIIGLLGALTVIPIYVVIYLLQSHGRSAASISMASMHMNRMGVFWSFPVLQATGLAALVWAYLGVALGLTVSGQRPSWVPVGRGWADRIHRQISLLVIGLILVHALATAFDAMGDSLGDVFIPWQERSWPAATFSYNLGIFALYIALLLGPTFYLRRRLGSRAWRFAHRFTLLVYVLSVWHALIIGADVEYYHWLRPLIWAAQIPLLLLFARRLLQPAAVRPPRTWALAVRYFLVGASAVATVVIGILLVTGDYASLVPSIQ
jgi:hypothetical protein